MPQPKLITLILVTGITVLTSSTFGQIDDPEFDQALQRGFESGMTKYDTQQAYQPMQTLTREQGAKMFSVFAMKNLCMIPDESLICEFSDIQSADPTLREYLEISCQLGLFQGFNGKFMPQQPLTKAQALTVLIRAMDDKQDESTDPRWQNYFDLAQEYELTKETDVRAIDRSLTRYESLLIQYRAKSDTCADNSNSYSQELLDVLEELFGEPTPSNDTDSKQETESGSAASTSTTSTGATSTGATSTGATSTGATSTGATSTGATSTGATSTGATSTGSDTTS